jgi:DNA primase
MQGNKNANLDLIKERLNILDVVSTYIKLDKAGSQFRARCPFHSEKSPSFYVSPNRGSYHCFGCGEHGDIFSFVMKIEGINFKDALRLLADRAGVSISEFKKEESSSLIDILEGATMFFEHNFSQNPQAKEYLKNRGVKAETMQKFRIGFAPNDWRQLYTKLNKAGYTDEEIVTSGLCIKHEKGLYDRFRSRIMFPIMNASGKVVAYSGRILPVPPTRPGDESLPAKYVNSPETPMYHKSAILFGYNFAKQEIAKQKKVLVVEGQMDVVMAHQAGNTNTVAISGTAFTPEHISILKRFADTVVLALDTDKAGFAAMLKSAALALESDMEVEGIKLTDKDPADMIKTDMGKWEEAVKSAKPILTLITEIILEKEHIKPKQIQMLRRDLFPLLRVVKSPLLKETYIKEIAKQLDIDPTIIRQESEAAKKDVEIEAKKVVQSRQKLPQIEILSLLAETCATMSLLENENQKTFYKEKLGEYLSLQSEFSIESIPEEVLSREIIKLEKKKHDEKLELKAVDVVVESMFVFVKKLLEKKIDDVKKEIREGKDLELNLKLIQDLTKKVNNIRQNIVNSKLKHD